MVFGLDLKFVFTMTSYNVILLLFFAISVERSGFAAALGCHEAMCIDCVTEEGCLFALGDHHDTCTEDDGKLNGIREIELCEYVNGGPRGEDYPDVGSTTLTPQSPTVPTPVPVTTVVPPTSAPDKPLKVTPTISPQLDETTELNAATNETASSTVIPNTIIFPSNDGDNQESKEWDLLTNARGGLSTLALVLIGLALLFLGTVFVAVTMAIRSACRRRKGKYSVNVGHTRSESFTNVTDVVIPSGEMTEAPARDDISSSPTPPPFIPPPPPPKPTPKPRTRINETLV